eukprot:1065851-Rhodomonas_salina.1
MHVSAGSELRAHRQVSEEKSERIAAGAQTSTATNALQVPSYALPTPSPVRLVPISYTEAGTDLVSRFLSPCATATPSRLVPPYAESGTDLPGNVLLASFTTARTARYRASDPPKRDQEPLPPRYSPLPAYVGARPSPLPSY